MFEYASDETSSNDGTSGENPQVIEDIDEVVRLISQERIQQRTVEQRVVVLVLRVVKEMVNGPDHSQSVWCCVSFATQSQVSTIRTVQKTVEVLPQLQSLIEW